MLPCFEEDFVFLNKNMLFLAGWPGVDSLSLPSEKLMVSAEPLIFSIEETPIEGVLCKGESEG